MGVGQGVELGLLYVRLLALSFFISCAQMDRELSLLPLLVDMMQTILGLDLWMT